MKTQFATPIRPVVRNLSIEAGDAVEVDIGEGTIVSLQIHYATGDESSLPIRVWFDDSEGLEMELDELVQFPPGMFHCSTLTITNTTSGAVTDAGVVVVAGVVY